ncbi:unnamed protein product [Cuscuta epithymum]|uniref:Reverse transcriptase Ty1/copia-type domain-containing protein n=1 Tax=Cuscuta epithymum TaxID=186058 RepID=A0AAV0FVK3_9ASTE|nr:unnamed protein product [Cuscuta epithymum]
MKALVKGISSDFTKLEKSPELSPELTKSRRSFTGVQPRRVELHNASSRFHLHTLKPVRTPLATRTKLSLTDGDLLEDPSEYRSMVGALQYLTMTRPDITFAVHLVSQFMHAPRTPHLLAVKRIFRYLQGSISHGLLFRPSTTTPTIQAYSDADWAGCPDSSRSTSGFAIFLGPNLVS